MNPNKSVIDDLEKKFQTEMSLLLECSTKLGTCERIAMRIIPMFQEHPMTSKLIDEWDQKNCDGSLLVRAYTELDTACQQIHANSYWVKQVEQILEEVKQEGSCSNISDRDCEGLHVDAKGNQSTIKIPRAQAPCQRVYYKLRSLYVLSISKTWDMTFAPSAYRVIQASSQGEMAISIDTDPRYIWRQLRVFEECWAIRNDVLNIGWPRANGSGVAMWIEADQNFRNALRCRLASDFSFASHYGPDRKMDFFQPKILTQLVDRLLKEIILLLRQQAVEIKPKGPRAMKKEARKLAQSVLEKKLLPLSVEERKEYAYDSVRSIIWKAAQQSNVHGLFEACSETLINDECSLFAKKHGWKPKRGKKGSAVSK